MRWLGRKGGVTDVALDLIFVGWLLQILITGRLLPSELTTALHHPHQTAAVIEPAPVPPDPPPLVVDSEEI